MPIGSGITGVAKLLRNGNMLFNVVTTKPVYLKMASSSRLITTEITTTALHFFSFPLLFSMMSPKT